MRTLRDAVYGLAVGDALGLPVQFEERGFPCGKNDRLRHV